MHPSAHFESNQPFSGIRIPTDLLTIPASFPGNAPVGSLGHLFLLPIAIIEAEVQANTGHGLTGCPRNDTIDHTCTAYFAGNLELPERARRRGKGQRAVDC